MQEGVEIPTVHGIHTPTAVRHFQAREHVHLVVAHGMLTPATVPPTAPKGRVPLFQAAHGTLEATAQTSMGTKVRAKQPQDAHGTLQTAQHLQEPTKQPAKQATLVAHGHPTLHAQPITEQISLLANQVILAAPMTHPTVQTSTAINRHAKAHQAALGIALTALYSTVIASTAALIQDAHSLILAASAISIKVLVRVLDVFGPALCVLGFAAAPIIQEPALAPILTGLAAETGIHRYALAPTIQAHVLEPTTFLVQGLATMRTALEATIRTTVLEPTAALIRAVMGLFTHDHKEAAWLLN